MLRKVHLIYVSFLPFFNSEYSVIFTLFLAPFSSCILFFILSSSVSCRTSFLCSFSSFLISFSSLLLSCYHQPLYLICLLVTPSLKQITIIVSICNLCNPTKAVLSIFCKMQLLKHSFEFCAFLCKHLPSCIVSVRSLYTGFKTFCTVSGPGSRCL